MISNKDGLAPKPKTSVARSGVPAGVKRVSAILARGAAQERLQATPVHEFVDLFVP